MKNKTILFLLFILLASSCQQILFNDEELKRDINLDDFSAVSVTGIFDMVLIQDSLNLLKISGSNNIEAIDARVFNDTLLIDDNNGLTLNTKHNRLEIHFTNMDFFVTYDPVNFSVTDTIRSPNLLFEFLGEISEGSMTVECENLTVINSANTLGSIKINGKSESCSFFIRYGGILIADSLKCKNAEVTTETIGDVHINATESINATILGPGNIYYTGNPVITVTEKRGSGNLIKKK